MRRRPLRAVRRPGRHPFHPEIRLLDLPDDGFGGLHLGLVAIVRLDHLPQLRAAASEREGQGGHQILACLRVNDRQTEL